jgi:hypothetical protein
MKNRPWFQHYEKGVPHHIEEFSYNSLADLFNDTLNRYGDKKAFTNMGVSLTSGSSIYFQIILQRFDTRSENAKRRQDRPANAQSAAVSCLCYRGR